MTKERRKHPRFPVSLVVEIHTNSPTNTPQEPILGQTTDFALEGTFICVEKRLPVHTDVKLVIQNLSGEKILSVDGVVVHSIEGYGIGVQLVHLSKNHIEKIKKLIDLSNKSQ